MDTLTKEIEKRFSVKSTPKETLARWYKLLVLGRKIDNKASNYLKQALGWSFHASYAGHDGIQLAIGQIFDKDKDELFLYYRDILSALSSGMSTEEILLNGLSKANDVGTGGRHMSNHPAKPTWNIHSVSSCTGNHTLHAVGIARALKYYKVKGVAISSQGESSVSEGYVYEAFNGASREKLPVIFVIQDNGYGISVPKWEQTANRKVADNFQNLKHLRIIHCNGKDVFESINAMTEAKEHILKNGTPVIVQANCIRLHSHSNSDRHELYRDKSELSYILDNDPIEKYRRILLRYKRFSKDELSAMEEKAAEILQKAHKAALMSPEPKAESIHDFVIAKPYKAEKYPDGNNHKGKPRKLVEALNETLKAEFRNNPDTFLWGQDVAHKEKGGVFNVTKGMQQEFGRERIFNAPIAEDFIVGTANGMSRFDDKIRIVIEGAEFADYFWPAMENFVDTTHDYWRSIGQFSPNITIRLASAGYIGGGLYHSQTIEAVLTTFPGTRVVYPSFADDAAGLLRTAIRSRGLTLFLEPKYCYNSPFAATPIPDDYEIPFGKACIRRKGKDLSIITYGNTVHLSLNVAKALAKERNIDIEVVDLRSLSPLDEEAIITSVKKTNKVLVVHEDKVFSGFGGEIAALISDKAFEYLDAPIKRVGSTFTPVGFNRVLEKTILPSEERIRENVKELLKY